MVQGSPSPHTPAAAPAEAVLAVAGTPPLRSLPAGESKRSGRPQVSRNMLLTVQVRCLRPVFPSVTHRGGRGVGPPTVSRHEVSTVQVRCHLPVFPSVTHRAAGSACPQCHGHGTRCRLCRCAASGPSSLPSLIGPRGWAAHKCYDCWCLVCGPLPPCLPSGPAGVDISPTRIRTCRADV